MLLREWDTPITYLFFFVYSLHCVNCLCSILIHTLLQRGIGSPCRYDYVDQISMNIQSTDRFLALRLTDMKMN